MSKPNIVMDASQLDTYQVCDCKFDFRYNKNKTLPGKVEALDRGDIMHKSLEVYYRELKDGKHYNDACHSMMANFNAALAESELESSEIELVRSTLEECVDYWRVYDQNFKIDDVERPFIYLLAETNEAKIYLAGKVDLIITDNRYLHMPVDHKSFKRASESRRLNNQFINYANATDSTYLMINKIGLQTSKKAEEKFKRVPLSYDPLYIEQWKRNTVKWIERYLISVAENSWPMNPTSCDKYNRQCEYYEVCDSSGEEAKQYKLEANYISGEPWDVSKILEGEKDDSRKEGSHA